MILNWDYNITVMFWLLHMDIFFSFCIILFFQTFILVLFQIIVAHLLVSYPKQNLSTCFWGIKDRIKIKTKLSKNNKLIKVKTSMSECFYLFSASVTEMTKPSTRQCESWAFRWKFWWQFFETSVITLGSVSLVSSACWYAYIGEI